MSTLATLTRRIVLEPTTTPRHLLKCYFTTRPSTTSKTLVTSTTGSNLPSDTVRRHRFTTTTTTTTPPPPSTNFSYATVDHADAYGDEMAGRHGKQLALAHLEGRGKDVKYYNYVPEDDWDNVDDYFDEEGDDDDGFDNLSGGEENGGDDEEEEEEEEDSDDDDDNFVPHVVAVTKDPTTDSDRTYDKNGFPLRAPSQLAAFRAGAPSGGKFAIIRINGHQHKISVDDVIVNNKLLPLSRWAVGNTITLKNEEILLVGSPERTLVGMPFVGDGVEVDVMVEEITRDKKVIAFKKRRRKSSKRKRGFRRDVTFLRVLDIRIPGGEGNEHETRVA